MVCLVWCCYVAELSAYDCVTLEGRYLCHTLYISLLVSLLTASGSLLRPFKPDKTLTLLSKLVWKFVNLNKLISNSSLAQSSWNMKKSNFSANFQISLLSFWLVIHFWWFVCFFENQDLQPSYLMFFTTCIEK